jgi:membrane protease YdiL (CAAX protease family)
METNKDFPNMWHAILVLLLLLGVQIFIGAIFYDLGGDWSAGDQRYGGIISIFSCGIIFSAIMCYKNITYKQLFNPCSKLTKPLLIASFIGVLLTSCGGFVLLSDLDTFIIHQFSISQSDIAMFERLLGSGSVSIITVCIIAPFIEEMLFRGVFLRGFLRNYKVFNAVTFSALLFAVAHFNIYQMISAYIVGTFLGWLYVVTQSLWPCIFSHALFDAMSLIIYYLHGGYEKSLSLSYHGPVTIVFSVILIFLGIRIIQVTSSSINSEAMNIK